MTRLFAYFFLCFLSGNAIIFMYDLHSFHSLELPLPFWQKEGVFLYPCIDVLDARPCIRARKVLDYERHDLACVGID